jgi:ribosomal protein S18 acetylase RimI-like enzyme
LILLEEEAELCRAHLKTHYRRLGPRSRRLRFLGDATDAALDRMAERAEPEMVVEAVEDGVVRGVFEAYATMPGHAEIALSVEDDCQGRGLGRALFMQGLRALAERGFRTADLLCLRENAPVLALVRAAGGRVRFEGGEAVVEIELGRVLQEAEVSEDRPEQAA